MVDPHKELRSAPRRKRFAAWFRALSTPRKTLAITSGVLVVLTLIASIVVATLTVQSLTSDDLALYLAASPTTLATETGADATFTITASAKNLPFCTARCTYIVTDHLAGTVIDEGDVTLRTGIDRTLDVTYRAPATYERDGLVTVALTCANNPTTLCRSSGEERYAATAIKALTRYEQEREQARATFIETYDERRDAINRDRGLLETLAVTSDERLRALAADAQAQANATDETLAAIAQALAAEDYAQATERLAEIANPQALAGYAAAREQDEEARAAAQRIEPLLKELLAITPLATSENTEYLESLRDAFTYAVIQANATTLATTNERLTIIETSLAVASDDVTSDVNAALGERERLAGQDERVRCALYEQCTTTAGLFEQSLFAQETNESTDALSQVQTLAGRVDAYCAYVNESEERFTNDRLAYARAEAGDENATIDEALAALGVEDVTNRTDYASWRLDTLNTIANETNETLVNETVAALTPAERLALNPEPRTIPGGVPCDRAPPEQFPPLPEPLPELAWTVVDTPALAPPPRLCCDNGVCAACPATQGTPIVFVHGFSFSQGTTPETNLNAFGPLAAHLDEQDIARYLGHVFPQQFADTTTAVSVANLPGRSSMTATYYYDSYGQDGTLSLVTRKTENLETYAIRLREAIAVARARTGQDKVVIVAHSMGGLVTRRYLQLFGEDVVEAVVMIGTPNAGIMGRTRQFCGVLGSELECRDMEAGSVFLEKLNAEAPPSIPVYTIIGTGCDTSGEDGDGVITAASVRLPWATNIAVNGTCAGRSVLHSTLLDPTVHPDVAELVEGFVKQY